MGRALVCHDGLSIPNPSGFDSPALHQRILNVKFTVKGNEVSELQKVFDRVALHLLQQGERSVDGTRCLYRGQNGLKCAVGFLIADEHYSPELENKIVSCNPEVHLALQKSGVDTSVPRMTTMLGSLQYMHDNYPVESWHQRLSDMAHLFCLRMPELTGECMRRAEPRAEFREVPPLHYDELRNPYFWA